MIHHELEAQQLAMELVDCIELVRGDIENDPSNFHADTCLQGQGHENGPNGSAKLRSDRGVCADEAELPLP